MFTAWGGARATGHTRVVKLSSLANGKTTATNDKNLLDVDVLPGFYDSALEIGLGVGGFLGNAGARHAGRDGERPLLAQPGDWRLGLCAEEAVLGGRRQGRRRRDPATMAEDGRSAARLVHGRQHYQGILGEIGGRSVSQETPFLVSGSTRIARTRQLTVLQVVPGRSTRWAVGGGMEDGNYDKSRDRDRAG